MDDIQFWSDNAVGASSTAVGRIEQRTGFAIPDDYRAAIVRHAGADSLFFAAYYLNRVGNLKPVDRDFRTLLVPGGDEPGLGQNGSRISIEHHTRLFEEFVSETSIGPFLLNWSRSMLLILRNSNPQSFCFLDFRFDPVDPPVILIDPSELGSAVHSAGVEYVADSFSAMLAATNLANQIDYWESYSSLPPPTDKAHDWWSWRDMALGQ